MRATLQSVHATLLLACSLLFATPREASAVVILNFDPAIDQLDITDFLDLSYSVLLGRAPDPTGTAAFRAFLTSGGDTTAVATAIDTSREYYTRVVTAYYQKFLKVSPTASEVSPWVSQMIGGLTDEAVIAALVGSPEYQAVWGIHTPAELVAQMYLNLLGRLPDPGESAYWQSALSVSNAMTVAEAIENSTEYRSDLVTRLYEDDLDRFPDPTGAHDSLDFLNGGGTDEQLIALLVGSGEFLGDAEELGGSDDTLRVLEFRRGPSIPEPPAVSLLAIGMVCLAWLRRFRSPEMTEALTRHPWRGGRRGQCPTRPMSQRK